MFRKVYPGVPGLKKIIPPVQPVVNKAPAEPVADIPVHQPDVPFLLTRIYEGKKPFLASDQDVFNDFFKPLIRVPIEQPAQLVLADLVKVGEPGNRNGLGVFVNPANGEKYYIKKSNDAGKARNEVLCATLAGLFGVNVPRLQSFEEDGKHYIASGFIEGLKLANEQFPNCAIDSLQLVKIARECPAVQKAYVAATLLNNRDILGMGLDNIGFTSGANGSLVPHFVDFGGSGAYRATAGTKVFDANAKEFSSMTEPQLQADAFGGGPNGLVFGGISPALLQESLDLIFALPDIQIKAVIDRHIPDAAESQQFFDILIQRRNAIQSQLTAGTHDRSATALKNAVSYGIASAFDWDAEDPEIIASIHLAMDPEIAVYCQQNLHLLSDGIGQGAIATGVEALVHDLADRLLMEKNGARFTFADMKKQAAAEAAAAAAAAAPDA